MLPGDKERKDRAKGGNAMTDPMAGRECSQPSSPWRRLSVLCSTAVIALSLIAPTAAQAPADVEPEFEIPAEWIARGELVVQREVDRLVEVALQRHPDLDGAQADVGREVGRNIQSTRKPNPSFGYTGTEIGNEGRAGQQGLYLSQEWVTAGRLGLTQQVGLWQTRAASERLAQTRLRLMARVQTQYWSLVAARRRVALLAELEELLEDGVRVNKALHQAAEVSLGPVLQAQLEKSQVSVLRRQAEADLTARTTALAATLGVSISEVFAVESDDWPEPMALDELEAAQPWTLSPELAEAQALVEVARWNFRMAKTQIVSNIDSFAAVQHDAATDDVIVSLQVGMALPIHDRKVGLVRTAHAEVLQSEALYASRYRDLQARWAAAMGSYRAAVEMVQAIEHELLALAEERLVIARRGHEQGELDYIDLLTAQRSFLVIRQSALDARQQTALAAVRLQTLVAADSP